MAMKYFKIPLRIYAVTFGAILFGLGIYSVMTRGLIHDRVSSHPESYGNLTSILVPLLGAFMLFFGIKNWKKIK